MYNENLKNVEDDINIDSFKSDSLLSNNIDYDTLQLDEVIILQNITFDLDSYELKKESFNELNNIVNYLNYNKSIFVEISGHTDDSGSENLNQILSEKRAKAVAIYLYNNGVEKNRVEYKGYGSSKPIIDNYDEKVKVKNRRVEFKILKK